MIKEWNFDRTAEVCPKVVLDVERARIAIGSGGVTRRVPWLRIQPSIARVLEQRAVILRPAGLAHHRDLARGRRAILRSIVRSEHLHFLHHIGRHLEIALDRNHATLAHEAFLHGRAIQECLIPGLNAAVDAGVESLVAATGSDAGQ